MKRTAYVIFNPLAARTSKQTLDSVVAEFKAAGWSAEIGDVCVHGDAEELARGAVLAGASVVVVHGGDGTITKAIEGVLGTDTAIGVIPGGTGNLLAGNLRLPKHPIRAARAILDTNHRPIDVGRIRCGGFERYFSVGCGAGFDADITTGTSPAVKRRIGRFAYMMKTFEVMGSLKAVPHRVTIDGDTREVMASSVFVANCGEMVPPFFSLNKGISASDGFFDVVMMNPKGYIESIHLFWQLISGRRGGKSCVEFARGKVVHVEADRPQPVELDGDAMGTTPFTAEMIHHGVSVCFPRTARGFDSNGKAQAA